MAVHVVQKRDCITSIADQHGFYWETIWSHAENAGLRCSEVTISIKWRVDGKTPMPHILVLRGFAALREPTFFRAALVWRVDRWISALEANHSSQTWGEARPLAALVHALPGFVTPVRLVSDGSIEPQILRLDEQRRGSENDFDELIGG